MGDLPVRASDADREQAIVVLREHLLAGRLRLDEFSGRVEAALQATVEDELVGLREDLPEVSVRGPDPRDRPARFAAAVLGGSVRRGRLRLRKRALAASALGDLDLDLREATVEDHWTVVTVVAVVGNVDIYVPEGINVDVGGAAVFGHRRDWGRDTDRPDAPTIQVRVLGLVGTVDVWRVPPDMRTSSYSDIFGRLEDA